MNDYFSKSDCKIDDFTALVTRNLDPADLRFTDQVEKNIPVYDMSVLAGKLSNPAERTALMGEWARIFGQLSGVLVLKGAMDDLDTVDAATDVFEKIIEQERASTSGGDHFGERGANDRIWNSLQKLCLHEPAIFARYFASPAISAVSEAWLGPWYQMTAQINQVRPGGKAQACHRDYHLGFMTGEQACAFPAHAHLLSASLTLQGAVAHCDMPIESGPTKLLPFSQLYEPGYVAVLLPEYREQFEKHMVQLPLAKGDAVFFNPALFHAAGDNISADINRMANLLQVSSPMGRSLETVNRTAMVRALFPALQELKLPKIKRAAAIAAAAEGYPFPTNLDTDPPIGGLASESQAGLLNRALDEDMSKADFEAALEENRARRQP